MFSYIWPLGLVVFSNVFYQICAKSVPEKMNPFASLTITYVIGAIASLILYFVLDRNGKAIAFEVAFAEGKASLILTDFYIGEMENTQVFEFRSIPVK